MYWLGNKKCLADDTDTKTPPPASPTASVDDSKVKSLIQEWEDITGETIPSVHYLMMRNTFNFVEENEKLNVDSETYIMMLLQEEFMKGNLTNGNTIPLYYLLYSAISCICVEEKLANITMLIKEKTSINGTTILHALVTLT